MRISASVMIITCFCVIASADNEFIGTECLASICIYNLIGRTEYQYFMKVDKFVLFKDISWQQEKVTDIIFVSLAKHSST